jgi:hypothetical protein
MAVPVQAIHVQRALPQLAVPGLVYGQQIVRRFAAKSFEHERYRQLTDPFLRKKKREKEKKKRTQLVSP